LVYFSILDSSGGTLARTYTQSRHAGIDCRKIVFEQELASYQPVFLQSSCSDSAECKFEKILGFQNMCHSAIGMEHKLIHGQWVRFGTSIFITHMITDIDVPKLTHCPCMSLCSMPIALWHIFWNPKIFSNLHSAESEQLDWRKTGW
jgi:hypothetical protein